MADTGKSFETVALSELALALAPLRGLDSKQKVVSFFRQLGWELPAPDLDLGLADVAQLPGLVDQLVNAQTAADMLPAIGHLLQEVEALFKIIDALTVNVQTTFANAQNFLNNSGILENYELPRRLIDLLITTYLQKRHAGTYSLFVFLGLVDETAQQADPAHFRSACVLRRVRWERFPKLLADPGGVFTEVYAWGTPNFASDLLLERMGLVLRAFRMPGGIYLRDSDFASALDPGVAVSNPNTPGVKELRIPFFMGGEWPQTYVQLGAALARATDPDKSIGLALLPYFLGAIATDFPLGDKFILGFKSSVSLEGGAALVLMPGKGVTLRTNLLPGAGNSPVNIADGEITLSLKPAPSATGEIILFGQPEHSRVAAQKAEIYATGRITGGQGEAVLGLDLKGAKIVVSGADFDGFLSMVLPKDAISIEFDLGVNWSSKTGLHFSGGAGLEKQFSTHVSIFGVLDVDNIYAAIFLDPAASTIKAEASASMSLQLGPVSASVERMGLSFNFDFKPAGKGNLGIANVTPGFKPPNGVGLAIDASVVVGGGYLFFDFDKQQYAGVMELELAETISVKAIGLLTTRMPDGSKGFSLLVIITVEGFTPIQLGFGFTLTGIGGLLGVNRTASVDALRSGIRTGTVGSILFPDDPVRNAPRIVSDVGTVFPVAVNRFVFGPMVMINWGTPAIITLELGVVLEVPDPVRLIILGRLQTILPEPKDAVVQIRLDSLGVIDFAKGEISLDATLYDSRLLTFTLTGDMAMRINVGANPGFLLAVGGWNPRFPSPPGFPQLSRLAITLSSSENARLRLESYFAVTSNTVQFGAKADFFFGAGGFSVEGYLGFDALIHFSPFSFIADLSASVALRAGGTVLMSVGLTMTLSGPRPWHVWGKAEFKILFLSASVSFDVTYGPQPQPVLPDPVDVKTLLTTALTDARNWSSELPAGERPLVTFRATSGTTDVLSVHPLAQVAVRERVAPLDMHIDKFGNAPVTGDRQFSLKAVRSDNAAEIPSQNISDSFALAQFLEMSDDQKLSSPAFTDEHAGIRFTTGDYAYGYEPALDTTITYETAMVVPEQTTTTQQLKPYSMSAAAMDGVMQTAAVAQAAKQRTTAVKTRGIKIK